MPQSKDITREATLMHYWRVISSRIWVVLLPALVVPLTVFISSLLADPVYQSIGTLRMRDSEEMFAWKDQSVKLSTELEIIKSKSVLEDVVHKMRTGKEFQKYAGVKHFARELKDIKENVHAKRLGREVNIIRVSVDSHDPELARDMANVLMNSVIEHNLAYKRREAQQTRTFIEKQQERVGEKLLAADDALRAFQTRNKSVDMKMHIESQYLDPLSVVDPLAKVESELMPLREKVAALSKLYTRDYPELKQARAELAVREGYRKRLLKEMDSLPKKKSEYTKYLREREIYQRDYEHLALAAQKAHLAEVGVVSDFSIVDEARTPTFAIYPKTLLSTVTGALVGVVLGLFLAFLLEYLDTSIKDSNEVEHRLSLPLLGEIPHINLEAVKNKAMQTFGRGTGTSVEESSAISKRLVSHLQPKALATEAYRQLFINMTYVRPDGEFRTFAISSAGPGEGKSSTAANLCLVGASLGKKVLLIDGDLRKPVQHSLFGMKREPGLSEILIDGVEWRHAVRSTTINNFSILTSGNIPPAPMLLFNSAKFQQLIDELKSQYDLVIIDTPPINGMADTSIVASRLDGLLMVISQGKTDRASVMHAKQLLGNVSAEILGAVINNVSGGPGYGYSYYSHYGKYGYAYGGYYHHDIPKEDVLNRLFRVVAGNSVFKRIRNR